LEVFGDVSFAPVFTLHKISTDRIKEANSEVCIQQHIGNVLVIFGYSKYNSYPFFEAKYPLT